MTYTKRTNRRRHGLLALLLLCAALVAAAALGALATGEGSCIECGGSYDANGFCSDNDTHYQAPEGEGTADDPYKIASAGNLYWFAAQANVSTDEYEGDFVYAGCAVLTADITVNPGTFAADGTYTPAGTESAKEWIPIADKLSGIIYIGTFDGQGHSISGLYYNRNCEDDDGDDRAGLFGWVHHDGTVKNVTVQSSYFAATMFLGAIVGTNDGTVKNCHGRDNYLVGMGDDIGCSECIGGVVGWNYGTLDQLSNIGGAVSGKENIGGVVGYTYGDILNCYNTAPVTGTNAVGGVVGYAECQNIRFCYNIGTISCDNNAGSIVGYKEDEITFRGCYYQVAEVLGAIGNSTVAEGITPMTKEQFDSGYVVLQIASEWLTYVNEFNDRFSSEERDKRLKENVWFMDPATKLPAFDGDMVGRDGKISGTKPSAGNGTAADPYQIDSYLDLNWFGGMLKGNHDYSLCAKLTADIVANPGTFDADGNYTPGEGEAEGTEAEELKTVGAGDPYVGTFDGQGHTISGLYYKKQSDQGLFYNIGAGGTVKNVIIANSYFGCDDKPDPIMGAIAAFNYGTVENCGVLDSVYFNASDTTAGAVGGVVGKNDGGTVKSCFSAASVTSSGDRGGVVGKNYDGAVTNCYFLKSGELSGIGYDNTTGNTTTAVTDFSTGEVTYQLNGDQSAIVWYQTLGTDGDKYPVLDKTHGRVYRYGTTYSNSSTCPHDAHENGICTLCGEGYEEPSRDSSGTYLIENAGNLYWFAAQVNSGNTSINAKLTDHIIVNANVLTDGKLPTDTSALKQWTPIGNSTNAYTGTFNGQSYTISGLYYNYNGSDDDVYVGLFGYIVGGATIQNVGVIDSCFQVSGGKNCKLGGIVGYAYTTTDPIMISGCSSAALLTATGNYVYVGGVAGHVGVMAKSASVTIQSCSNTGEITATAANATATNAVASCGGVAGYFNANQGNATIQSCSNTGKITATTSGSAYCGGVAGYVSPTGTSMTIQNCYNTGDLTATSTSSSSSSAAVFPSCGGMVGYVFANQGNATIQNCFSTGAQNANTTSASGKAYSGGVTGFARAVSIEDNQATVTLSNCYFADDTATVACGDQLTYDGATVTTDEAERMTDEEFASGKVAWLLNGKSSDGVWKQTLIGKGKMSVPGFTGVAVNYNSETASYSNAEVVVITLSWTSMDFSCTTQYNTTTHDYTAVWTTTGGTFTVENTGTIGVEAVFELYDTNVNGVSGEFDTPILTVPMGEKKTAKLTLSGIPEEKIDSAPVGRVCVTIEPVHIVNSESELTAALASGDRIKLGKSFTAGNIIFSKNALLDLNGYELTVNSILISGENTDATICDSSADGTGKICNAADSTATNLITVSDDGALNVEGGTIVSTLQGAATNPASVIYLQAGTVNIYGGSIETTVSTYGIFAADYTFVTINGGSITVGNSAYAIWTTSYASVTIYNGTFKGQMYGQFHGNLTIRGGVFSEDPGEYVDTGNDFISDESGDVYVVWHLVYDFDALRNAVDTGESWIRLANNINTDWNMLWIGGSAPVTIDLNGFQLFRNDSENDPLIYVCAWSTLTILDSTESQNGMLMDEYYDYNCINIDGGKVYIQGGTICGALNVTNSGTICITGGRFNTRPNGAFIAAGYTCVDDTSSDPNRTFYVVESST